MPFAARQQRTKIPVTIITGFLGAGKTTLLNHLLKERGAKSIAVIENEFGEINIDSKLVTDNLLEKEDLISLENGCVCCSLRKDIVKAFAEIECRAKQRKKPVDAIIMETTGLADPAPVAFTFFANPWVASRFKLDSIMCVVDSRYLMQHLEEGKPEDSINEALQQIAFSDLILLNKIDLVTDEQKARVLEAVNKINTTARIVEVQLNIPERRPSIDKLLGINSFSIDKALELDPNFLESDSEQDEDHPHTRVIDAPNNLGVSRHSHQPSTSGRTEGQAAGHHQPMQRRHRATTHTPGGTEPKEAELCQSVHAGMKHGLEYADDDSDMEAHVGVERHPKRHSRKLHDLSDVSSVGITARGPLDEYRFNMFMRDLLAEKAKDIFRCKGVLFIHGYETQKFVFQGVHETICYGPCDQSWKEDEPRMNQIVFIGRGLDRKALIEGLRTCVWVPLPDGWQEFRDPVSKRVFYSNKATGEKSWSRPESLACAHVVASQGSTEQPINRRPRMSVPS